MEEQEKANRLSLVYILCYMLRETGRADVQLGDVGLSAPAEPLPEREGEPFFDVVKPPMRIYLSCDGTYFAYCLPDGPGYEGLSDPTEVAMTVIEESRHA